MKINKVVVIGAGTMGSGIAQVVAQSGYKVAMQDISDSFLSKAQQGIEKSLSKLVEKKKISAEEKENILSRLSSTTSLDVVPYADLVIEAVFERLDLKVNIFEQLDRLAPSHAILASNTSSLPISAIAAATKRPQQVVGMHFMNPVPIMKGVELVRGRVTSKETIDAATQFVKSLNRSSVVAEDYAGFISSRIEMPMLNEAAYSIMDGNTPKDVDECMKFSTNVPQGPCSLMDLIGIDIVVYVLGILEEEFGPKFKAAPLLKQMVRAGHLGRKTGRGFYEY